MKKKIQTSFTINYLKAKNFAKTSGDYNKIHLNKTYALNSIFGEVICHGGLVIINVLKKINLNNFFKNNFNRIDFNFKSYFTYNNSITILKKKKKINVYQNKQNKLEIKFINKIDFDEKDFSKYKKNLVKIKLAKTNYANIKNILMCISKYVGMKYPGENSLIQKICIIKKKSKKKKLCKTFIFSKQINKSYPFIYNHFEFANFKVFFISLIRPKLIYKATEPNQELVRAIKKIKSNTLIIGASNGIGKELCQLFSKNKKIKVIGTFNKNKIRENYKNLIKIKFDVIRDINNLKKIIKKYKIMKIYYMATPKINVNSNDLSLKKKYNEYYIKKPLEVLRLIDPEIFLYYPSTIFINKKNNYSLAKKKFEIEIRKNMNYKRVVIHKIPEINTRQNLGFFKRKLPSFIEYLNRNKSQVLKIL